MYGAWVLAIGAARYLFLAGEWLLPWMRAPLPPRRWRKVVAAAQGIVLTVAAAEVLPRALTQALLVAALAALAASVGECVWWLWRRRHAVRDQAPAGDVGQRERGPLRTGIAVALTVLALLLVWAAARRAEPAEPAHPRRVRAAAARAPRRRRRWPRCCPPPRAACWPWSRARCWRCSCVVKVLDMGFITAFDRPFDPVSDSSYVGIGIETLRDAIGRSSANLAVAAIAVLFVGLLAAPGAGAAAPHARRGRPPRLGAPGRRRARRRLGGPPRPRRAGRLHERRRPRRRRGAGGAAAACTPTRSSPARSPATASAPLPATGC